MYWSFWRLPKLSPDRAFIIGERFDFKLTFVTVTIIWASKYIRTIILFGDQFIVILIKIHLLYTFHHLLFPFAHYSGAQRGRGTPVSRPDGTAQQEEVDAVPNGVPYTADAGRRHHGDAADLLATDHMQ